MRVIAVQNYASSGTTLLHSLFDGHPEILQLPGLYGIGYYSHWRIFAPQLIHADSQVTRKRLDDLVLSFFSALHEPQSLEVGWGLRELGHNRDQHPCPSKERFVEAYGRHVTLLTDQLPHPTGPASLKFHRRARILAIYLAYEEAMGRDLSQKKFLCYPAHSCTKQDLLDLIEDFSDVFFIHMVRNPINLFNSAIKYYMRHRAVVNPETSLFASAITQIFLDRSLELGRDEDPLHSIYFYDQSVKERSRAVRLEDLHKTPRDVLEAICGWTGLAWRESLLQSTFGGLQWWNRPGIARVSGFDSRIVSSAIQTYTTAFDEARLDLVGLPILERYYPEGRKEHRRRGSLLVASLRALQCLAPFKLETEYFDQLRAQFGFSRHMRWILPFMSARYYEHARHVFTTRARRISPDSHVISEADSRDAVASSDVSQLSGTKKLVWHFADEFGRVRTIEIKGVFDVVDDSLVTLRVASTSSGWRLFPASSGASAAVIHAPRRLILKIANRYCFLLDYFRNRWLLAKAAWFTRRARSRQVPMLYELPRD